MPDKLDLIIGKPDIKKEKNEGVATYTRFVLPFAFQLQAAPEITKPPELYYKLNDKTDISYIKRRKYFTRETASTLYERGQWLSTCDEWKTTPWGKAEIAITLRGQEFKIGMLPPQIVLFEVPEIKHQKQADILQTGFLSVDIYFSKEQKVQPQLDDLLILNEFLRYFGIPYDDHAEKLKEYFSNIPVTLNGKETIGSLTNSLHCYFERWSSMLEIPLKDKNNNYYQLFSKEWNTAAKAWMYNEKNSNKADHWQIYADNRCYVWTVAFLNNGGKKLKQVFEPGTYELNAKDYGHWIKLLNIDPPSFDINKNLSQIETHKSVSQFERQWADQRTYKRWEHNGTWYGFCYHGAAILAPPEAYIFLPSVSYYFDTAILLFYIRMTLFRFGRELSQVIEIETETKKRKKLRTLRRQFSNFTILYRFPLPSNQQQSIEMYELNRNFLDLDQFFEEIQQEIDNTHEFLETIESTDLAKAANKLANWGIPLAAGGLITALFSMSDFNLWQCSTSFSDSQCSINVDIILQTIIVFMMSLGTFLGLKIYDKFKKNK